MTSLSEQIDSLLPQTQCRDCDYDDCRSYANAIASDNEKPNKCLPGGEQTLRDIAALLAIDPAPYLNEIQQNAKAITLARIREDECIGCTKCIQACPVNAIIGAAKHMHSIITDACNGCELCLPPCPVDCIDLLPNTRTRDDVYAMANQSRERYQHQQHKKEKQQRRKAQSHQQAKLHQDSKQATTEARQSVIQQALQRAQQKQQTHER